MRLALVCGLAEMLTVAAIRDATPDEGPMTLCLYGAPISMPEALHRQSLADAELFGPWSHVIDCIGTDPADRLDHLNPRAVLTHTLGGNFETQVFDLFPQAALEFFDNGLVSHVDVLITEHPNSTHKTIPRTALNRLSRAWFTLLDDLPRPAQFDGRDLSVIESGALRRAARRALDRMAPTDLPRDGAPARLILGTSFYRTGTISHAKEREIYRSLVEKLWSEGDVAILYKEHPRANLDPLLSEADGVEVVESRMPVEVWAEARPITEAYSISSTALLSLKRIYGTSTAVVGADHVFPAGMAHIALIRSALRARC